MSSPLRLLRSGVRGMDLGHGILGYGLNAGVAAGTGYLVGRARMRHPDKWYGEHSQRLAAIGGKVLGVVTAVAMGPGIVSGAFDTVGNSGLALMGCKMGIEHEGEKIGREVQVVPKGSPLPAGGRRSYLGAGDGRGMSLDQIADLATSY